MKFLPLPLLSALAITIAGFSSLYWHAQYVKLTHVTAEIVKANHDVEAQYMQTPVSVIGIVSCDKFMGTLVITGDGQIHEEGISAEDAHKIAEQLASGASVLAKLPCQGAGT